MFKLTFPREVGPPRKLVKNKKEWLDYVNLHNGKKKAIYTSIYSFNDIDKNRKVDYNSAVVDKIFFDFDDKSCNAYENCKLLHNECLKEDLKHIIVMSGRGYHLYILTASTNLKYKKEAVRGGQEYFINKLHLKVDEQVVGNIAQLARVPNTYHIKAGRFCIPLTQEQFDKGDEKIKKLAESQNLTKSYLIGSKMFDISIWDYKVKDEFEGLSPSLNLLNSSRNTSIIKDLPLCISKCLSNKNIGWKARYLIILYFKEQGYSKQEVYSILKQHLSEVKLHHCIQQEHQLQYLFDRNDLVFPACKKIKEDGFCVGKCKFYNQIIYV